MGHDFLLEDIARDAELRKQAVLGFVILASLSLLLGYGVGRMLNNEEKGRMPGATYAALFFGCILGFVMVFMVAGCLRAVGSSLLQPGMGLVGPVVCGLTAVQRATVGSAKAKVCFAMIWTIASVWLLAWFGDRPAREAGYLQLLGFAGLGMGIVQFIRAVVQASRKGDLANQRKDSSFDCAYCDRSIPYAPGQAGQKVQCPSCLLSSPAPAVPKTVQAEVQWEQPRQLVGEICVFCRERIESIAEGCFCAACGAAVHHKCVQADDLPEDTVNCRKCGSVPGLRSPQ